MAPAELDGAQADTELAPRNYEFRDLMPTMRTQSKIYVVSDVVVDGSGTIYVTENMGKQILKITPQ